MDEIAQETKRAMSFYIQKAVELYIKEYADLQKALDRLNDPAWSCHFYSGNEDQTRVIASRLKN